MIGDRMAVRPPLSADIRMEVPATTASHRVSEVKTYENTVGAYAIQFFL